MQFQFDYIQKDRAYPNGERASADRAPTSGTVGDKSRYPGIQVYERLEKSLKSLAIQAYIFHMDEPSKDAKSFRLWIITLALLALAAWTYFRK